MGQTKKNELTEMQKEIHGNWGNENLFPDENSDDDHWIWEFMRRNNTYQDDWQKTINGDMKNDDFRIKWRIQNSFDADLLNPTNLNWTNQEIHFMNCNGLAFYSANDGFQGHMSGKRGYNLKVNIGLNYMVDQTTRKNALRQIERKIIVAIKKLNPQSAKKSREVSNRTRKRNFWRQNLRIYDACSMNVSLVKLYKIITNVTYLSDEASNAKRASLDMFDRFISIPFLVNEEFVSIKLND